MGTISFFIGLRKENKTDLVFGIMGLCLFLFLLLPPGGFILFDRAPYDTEIVVKRVFIFSYYVLFPWFIKLYTEKKSNKLPALISLLVLTVFWIMFFTTENRPWQIWSMGAELAFGSIALYGIVSGISHYRAGEKGKAKWFILALGFYGFLFLLMVTNQATGGFISERLGTKMFFPIHFHSLFLMLIIGLRLVADVFEKYQLEKLVRARDERWQSFMLHAPVFVLEVDNQANITYVNDFALKELGYNDSSELLSKNCFEMISLPSNVKSARMLFDKMI
jgi:PAS domain-containing protein